MWHIPPRFKETLPSSGTVVFVNKDGAEIVEENYVSFSRLSSILRNNKFTFVDDKLQHPAGLTCKFREALATEKDKKEPLQRS